MKDEDRSGDNGNAGRAKPGLARALPGFLHSLAHAISSLPMNGFQAEPSDSIGKHSTSQTEYSN